MNPSIELGAVKKLAWWEHAVRFLFGGLVTVGAGLVGEKWGPTVGGLFLAFPAILPAALTLVRRHDGRARAADDARGATLGAIGLAAFALTVVLLAPRAIAPPFVLTMALVVWALASAALWWLWFGRRRAGPPR